jgi:tRNA-specific 2-thiouridylase
MNSLGLDKAPKNTRVVVAMSGGVDSSVTAALYRSEGYDVVGITMKIFPEQEAHLAAAEVANKLGIEHHVLDCVDQFKREIIDDFADTYLRGETPSPCIRCNKRVKFGTLLDKAKALGADALATGHYVRREMGATGVELHMADDERRDQSYFLFLVPKERLAFVRFPLGVMTSKAETRALARKFDLPAAETPDSQDVCFLPDADYAGYLSRLRPHEIAPGEIVDEQGQVLGTHPGIIYFTIGQRKGLNISARLGDNNEPLFVLRLDAANNRVVVGPRAALAQTEVWLSDVNWLAEEVPEGGLACEVRLRSSQTPVAARFYVKPEGHGLIRLAEPTYGIAAGQAGVVYLGSRVLGGGWIVKSENKGEV